MEAQFTFQKGQSKKINKFSIIGDLTATPFVRDARLKDLVNSYLGEVYYSRVVQIPDANISSLAQEKNEKQDRIDEVKDIKGQTKQLITEYSPDCLIFCLGQTDIDIDYYYKALILKDNIDDFIPELVSIYAQFLIELRDRHQVRIFIKGVNPSVLVHESTTRYYISRQIARLYGSGDKETDLEMRRMVINGLANGDYDYPQRFALSRSFNDALKQMAEEIDAVYFDIWDSIIDCNSGMVAHSFMPAKEAHNLLDTCALRQIHYDALKQLNDLPSNLVPDLEA